MIEFKPEEILVETLRIPLENKPLHSFQYHRFGIMVTHLPTGLTSSCEEHRYQHLNKAMALNLLSEKVETYYIDTGYPNTLPQEYKYLVEDATLELGDWDWLVCDRDSYYEPIAAFLNKEMAEGYCDWVNNTKI